MSSPPQSPAGNVSRRDFLRVGGLGVVGLSLAERQAAAAGQGQTDVKSCIFLLMAGGASQLETFDPKPESPISLRGPLKAIATAVPGVAFSESLPKLAERANRFSVIRSVTADVVPLHETAWQLLHSGRLAEKGIRFPSFGSVISQALGPRGEAPPYVVIPNLIADPVSRNCAGQAAGSLGENFGPRLPQSPTEADAFRFPNPADEQDGVRRRYGDTRCGRLCLQARQLVETGVRCVAVNLFDTLHEQPTWDCHAHPSSPGTLYDYRDTIGPQFDRAVAALLDDLHDTGRLEDTLVVATGEFGRTPKLNANGGRDHWPGVWSALVAGGGVRGGMVIGCSDAHAAAPKDRPVHPGELIATINRAVGMDAEAQLQEPDGSSRPLCDQAPIAELFA